MHAYLGLGILAYGFVRARGEDCGASRQVPSNTSETPAVA